MWHYLFLGNGADAFLPTTKIQEAFMLAFMAAGGPVEMAIFSKSSPGAHDVTLYFSPAATPFAKTIPGVVPCNKPSQENIGLIAGDQRCWDILFPSAL